MWEVMTVNQRRQPPPVARVDPEVGPGRPRVVRMPADWWESPTAVRCPLGRGPQSARAARRLTKDTLRAWGLTPLAEDAEIIVGELAANAITHAAPPAGALKSAGEHLGLRLLRRPDEVICAVLDPSERAPVLKAPGSACAAGLGLQIVDALSDVWGWSPVPGRGKVVWAILFAA